MTMTIQDEREKAVAVLSPRANRVAVPPRQDPPLSVTGPLAEVTVEHVDGDLGQARVLSSKHPGSPTALARLASSELSFGHRDNASKAAQEVLKSDTVDAPALIVASQVLVALGEISSAEQALHTALAAATTDDGSRRAAAALAARVAAHQGEPEKTLELLAHSGGHAASALEGALLAQMGRYDDAIRVLRTALRDVPDAPGTLCSLGYAYAAAGSIRKAIRVTTAAAALAPADRSVGLNLAAMLLAQDKAPEAVAAINRLADHHPGDVRVELAAAAVQHTSGDRDGARRRLRRLKATKAARAAAPAQRGELELEILLLDTPPLTRSAAFAAASEALKRCDHSSERIAKVLASAAQSTEDLATLEAAYSELRKHHNRTTLLPVESRVAFLRFEFERCLDASVEWARLEPFSAAAHLAASYLLSLYAGDYKEAADVGLRGIRRGIRSAELHNNVAFALAMDAKPDKAAWILPDLSECELALATAGLIEIVRGDLDQGISMYEDCARRVRQDGGNDLADLVDMHRILAEIAAGRTIPEDRLAGFAKSVSNDPRFAIVHGAITRERA